jgi:hypothetical protein
MMNPWLSLNFRAARLTWEAQSVMALRLMKLAGGGAAARSEAHGMITEKLAAFSEAQAVVVRALLASGDGSLAARRALNVYSRKVRANRRRLRG